MPQAASQIIPIHLVSLPGCKRDGTVLEGNNYVDVQWCRFQRGLPRKIGGYRRLTNLITESPRALDIFAQNNETYTHVGSASYLQQMQIDPNGVVSAITDRTPVGFAASASNMWQFAQLYDGTSHLNRIIAHAAPNLSDISNSTAGTVYYGTITAGAVLTDSGATAVSGGVTASPPYVFAFGTDGVVYWCVPNNPADWSSAGSGSARITAAKVVAGAPLRAGAGNAPAALFWTLDRLIRATFISSTIGFQFDTITAQSSVLSSQGIIEYDGIYFWVGVDRFLMFNGVVRELPNNMNINYFFDGLNFDWRQKVFAYKVPRYGEIWWCYPRGSATECTHAIIYNVREDIWYDTELPNSGRSCGQYAQVFRSPLMGGVDVDSTSAGYKLWQHEFGSNELDGTSVLAVYSAFETAEIGFPASENPQIGGTSNMSAIVNCLEPDFVQTGNMELIIKTRWNARSPEAESDPYSFPDTATTPQEQLITIREQGRYMRFRFESNVQDGDYQMGKPLFHLQQGDARIRS